MKIIDDKLLNEVGAQAKESPSLRMNYNFHQSLDEMCHRFINAVEPGTVVEIHRHPIIVCLISIRTLYLTINVGSF